MSVYYDYYYRQFQGSGTRGLNLIFFYPAISTWDPLTDEEFRLSLLISYLLPLFFSVLLFFPEFPGLLSSSSYRHLTFLNTL